MKKLTEEQYFKSQQDWYFDTDNAGDTKTFSFEGLSVHIHQAEKLELASQAEISFFGEQSVYLTDCLIGDVINEIRDRISGHIVNDYPSNDINDFESWWNEYRPKGFRDDDDLKAFKENTGDYIKDLISKKLESK